MNRIDSFKFALEGIVVAFKEETHLRIHFFMILVVVIAAVVMGLGRVEWLILILTIGFVVATELLNTAIENICDHVTPEHHLMIKKIKDISAGAVLIASLIAVLVGGLIFIPKIISIY